MELRRILIVERSEELAEQIRGVAAELAEPVEIVPCTRIGSVDHLHEHDGRFDVLVAGPSLATRAGLRRLSTLHRQQPEVAIVMCMSARPDASLRDIVQVGADDLLEMPADDASVRAVIKRALEIASHSAARATSPAPAAAVPAPSRNGQVLTVSSATGGCGKTFYAANLAYFLAANAGGRVAMLDIDLQFGEISTALRLQSQHTIFDLLRHEESAGGAEMSSYVEDFMVPFEGRFSVLTAPKEPSQADRITPVEVTRVIEALRARFDYVVVDTPGALAETVLAALDLSQHLFVMATLDLPSVRNLGVFLQTLEKLRVPTDNVSLVLNKVDRDLGIDVAQIVELFPQGFRSELPFAKEVSRSINFGKPVLESFPAADVSRKLVAGMVDLLPEAERHRAQDVRVVRSGGMIGRLFKRAKVAAAAEGVRG